MMSNYEVIKRFCEGRKGSNVNLKSDGCKLINYSTCIAEWCDGVLYFNETKYSVSTSKIQTWCRCEFASKRLQYVSVEGVWMDAMSLPQFAK